MSLIIGLFLFIAYLEGVFAWASFFDENTPTLKTGSFYLGSLLWPFLFVPLMIGFIYIMWPRPRLRKKR